IEANLTGANLKRANFDRAILIKADLRRAFLTRTTFGGTVLDEADFSGAVCLQTIFADVDLRNCIGLDTMMHSGPSQISIHTLYRSQGRIPDIFLQRCGVSDEMIVFVHSLQGAIQYYSAFISYNHEDEPFATRLYNDLQMNNV